MSIVNDALKKVGKKIDISVEGRHACSLPPSDKKWIAIITASLVIVASLFGSLILYKNISGFNPDYASDKSDKPASVIQSTLNNIEQKTVARAIKSQDAAKLNGIVYGDEGKWAIVNNRIVKEGDKLLGGEITSITRDLVKIEKNDGSVIALSLK